MIKPSLLSILIGAAFLAGCLDPATVAPGSPFVTVLIDHEFNVDYGAGFATPTVMPAASGAIDVVYGDFERGSVKYADCASSCRDSASWTTVVVDSNGYDPAATRTASGLHAIYLGNSTFPRPLRYAFCAGSCPPGSSWSGSAVDTTSYAVSAALAADPSGGLHVVYGDYTAKQVRYAECVGNCLSSASWASVELAQLQNPLAVNSGEKQAAIAVDAAGTVHLVYATQVVGVVRYSACPAACSNPASWQTATIDSGPTFGTVTLALDAGALHVAYIAGPAADNGQRWTVRYASCTMSCATPAAWTRGDLSTGATWTGDQGVALSAGGGGLHLAFLRSGDADVVYAVCTATCADSTHWQRTLLGRNGAQAVGLAVLASDQPSLTAVTNGSFWYAMLK